MKYLVLLAIAVSMVAYPFFAEAANVDIGAGDVGGNGYFVRHVYTNQSTAVTAGNADSFRIDNWTAWTVTIAGEGVLANYSGDLVVQGSVNNTDWITLSTETGDTGPQVHSSTFGAPYLFLRMYYTPDGVKGDITTIDADLLLVK